MGILVFSPGILVFSPGISVNPGYFGKSMYRIVIVLDLIYTNLDINKLSIYIEFYTNGIGYGFRRKLAINSEADPAIWKRGGSN